MRKILFLGASVLAACGTPVPEPMSDGTAAVAVTFEPSADPSQVSSLVHLHLGSTSLSPGAVSLFRGTLSSYYLAKLAQGEVPQALGVRRVPVVSWRSDPELVVAPLEPLALGPYSLASAGGLLQELQVTQSLPVLRRVWPVPGAGGLRFVVYCSEGSGQTPMPSEGALSFEPRELVVSVLPGVDDAGLLRERCVHFEADSELAEGERLVPPPVLGEWALDPALFSGAALEAPSPLVCRAGELPFGPGCASAADDRVVVRTPLADTLWLVHSARGASFEATRSGVPLTIAGLSPGSLEHLWGTAHDLAGRALQLELSIAMAPARERPILNEALADALGPEPQSEWVELFNDGTLAVDLAGYALQDGGGRTHLPHAWLAPKAYALLVREDFAPNASDEPPASGTRLIRLPMLGKSGLSNGGERLALVDGAGVERSVLPALSGKSGQSLARRAPEAQDDDPRSFSFGAPTPGGPNVSSTGGP